MSEQKHPPICCYCDNNLSCGICGMEQPADYPHGIFDEVKRLRNQLEGAITFIRILNEECVLAGMPGGDRAVTLSSVRKLREQLETGRLTFVEMTKENDRLREQLVKANDGLKLIASMARFELNHPTDLRDTAFSLIEKRALTALTDEEGNSK